METFYPLIITKMTIYDYEIIKRDWSSVKMEEFKWKVLIIVNTATWCGFTPQYEWLEILDFPCDQFGHQAPWNDDEIHQFCTMKYNTTFDQFSKIEVNWENESPLFTYLKQQKSDDEIKGLKNRTVMMWVKQMSSTCKNKWDIIWNFTKFLVDKDWNVVNRYSPTYVPWDMEEEIQKLLG